MGLTIQNDKDPDYDFLPLNPDSYFLTTESGSKFSNRLAPFQQYIFAFVNFYHFKKKPLKSYSACRTLQTGIIIVSSTILQIFKVEIFSFNSYYSKIISRIKFDKQNVIQIKNDPGTIIIPSNHNNS